jgi:hypothetical protein
MITGKEDLRRFRDLRIRNPEQTAAAYPRFAPRSSAIASEATLSTPNDETVSVLALALPLASIYYYINF